MSMSKGGYIPGPSPRILIRELRPWEPGDIDDVTLDNEGRPKTRIRWNLDGSMSYRGPHEPTTEDR